MDNPIKKKFTDPKSVMFSNAWWSNLHKNWWQILLKFASMTLIVFWLIWMAITPLINFNSYFKWFRKGRRRKVQKLFQILPTSLCTTISPFIFISAKLIHSENIDSQYQAKMLLYLIATYSDQLGLGQSINTKSSM